MDLKVLEADEKKEWTMTMEEQSTNTFNASRRNTNKIRMKDISNYKKRQGQEESWCGREQVATYYHLKLNIKYDNILLLLS